MLEEEKEKVNDGSSPAFSWWSDSHNRPCHSQWLQATLSDLDKKTKMIVKVIEGEGDSFAKRADMFFKKRHELIQIVQDLHNSYRSLAEKYDQLRSECTRLSHSRSPPPSSLLKSTTKQGPETLIDSVIALNSLNDDLKKVGDVELDGNSEFKEKVWNELRLKVSKLIEDNLRQQTELVRRNDEKREVIKHLRAQINKLMEENGALKSCLPSYKVDMDMEQRQTHTSKLKGLNCNCIGKFKD